MVSDLFLIAHKVSGEPAFDIAEKMECSLCHGKGCFECDDCGYWWITSTGHRPYPYDYIELSNVSKVWLDELPPAPEGWRDSYGHSTAPRPDRLTALLAA